MKLGRCDCSSRHPLGPPAASAFAPLSGVKRTSAQEAAPAPWIRPLACYERRGSLPQHEHLPCACHLGPLCRLAFLLWSIHHMRFSPFEQDRGAWALARRSSLVVNLIVLQQLSKDFVCSTRIAAISSRQFWHVLVNPYAMTVPADVAALNSNALDVGIIEPTAGGDHVLDVDGLRLFHCLPSPRRTCEP